MKKLLLVSFILIINISLFSATYYVATYGDDNYPGTFDKPFKTLEKGFLALEPGDTAFVMPGLFYGDVVNLNYNHGTEDNYIHIFPYYEQYKPIITSGLRVTTCSYLHMKGFEITTNPVDLIGEAVHHNIFENFDVHHIEGTEVAFSLTDLTHDNLVLNCDFHDNQLFSGSHCDGISIWAPNPSSTNGPYNNTVRYCRSYFNNDDGFDTWCSGANNRFEYCWSYGNGKDSDFNDIQGDGNGFKLGQGEHNCPVVINCLAWNNKTKGFDENANQAGGITVYNCTAYDNGSQNFAFFSNPTSDIVKNCISIDGSNDMSGCTDTYNNWNLNITASSSDFVTMDFSANMGPRKADGSLPDSDFLHLVSSSNLIDKGTDVGIDYSGSAPDLGAYEYTSVSAVNGSATIDVMMNIYPNPSKNTTTINYTISELSIVSLVVYDITGKEVEVIANETTHNAGNYSVKWDGSNLKEGVYFIQLQNGINTVTNKILLQR